jgi:peptidoglycan/xylan/chitin deacetylase (PgdA/CDA1 family)
MAAVTNVCFHGIGTPDRVLEPGEADYWIGRDAFLGILDVLAGRPDVRISFDDGNASDVEIALPALAERGLTATFFVLAGRLDAAGSLARDHVRELGHAGMRIGTHGMHHRSWRGMSSAESHHELVEAREAIAEVAGQRIDEAALPLGMYDRRVLAQLRRHGYRRVFTSDRARASESAWLSPRHSVVSTDTAASLREAVLVEPGVAQRAERLLARTVKRLR